MRTLEDFAVGDVFDLGETTVTEEEIIRFGREVDPQPFHVDPVAAKESAFGGLVASGWHVAGIFMRRFVDSLLRDAESLGGLGVDDMHWKFRCGRATRSAPAPRCWRRGRRGASPARACSACACSS